MSGWSEAFPPLWKSCCSMLGQENSEARSVRKERSPGQRGAATKQPQRTSVSAGQPGHMKFNSGHVQ